MSVERCEFTTGDLIVYLNDFYEEMVIDTLEVSQVGHLWFSGYFPCRVKINRMGGRKVFNPILIIILGIEVLVTRVIDGDTIEIEGGLPG
jgi:hypothetical protein